MRRVIIVLLVLISGSTLYAQSSPQLKFDNANDLLESGDYLGALEEYRAIEESENMSGALYLNMGIAAVQIDSLGLAKFYFLKAQKFEQVHESADKALDFVNSQFSRQSAKLPKLPWDRIVGHLKLTPGTFGLFIIGYIFFCITLLIVISGWFNWITIPKKNQIVISGLVVSMLVISLAYYVDYVDQRYDEAVLIVEESSVSASPNEDSELVSMAYEGYDLTIDWKRSKTEPNWYYVRLGNGQFGWIEDKGINIL